MFFFLCFFLLASVRLSTPTRVREDAELTQLFTRLWNADTAKARPGVVGQPRSGDIRLDLGGHTRSASTTDAAPRRLFQYVNEGRLFDHASTRALISLLNNYAAMASRREDQERNAGEKREIDNFLNLVLRSPTMRNAFNFLRSKGVITTSSTTAWKTKLYNIWFKLYSRERGVLGSSGFEHAFLGEIDGGEVKGVHNWIWVYLKEKAGWVDYQGYLATPTRDPRLLSVRLNWRYAGRDYRKTRTSFLVGSTPEFDMALFTVCFLKYPNGVASFKINGTPFKIQTWSNRDGTLGSAYFLG